MSLTESDAVIIGGGAAGLMCAITAAERGLRVAVIEPNRELGRKLRITGKGRCNVTNHCSIQEMMRNLPMDGRFLYPALNRFNSEDTEDFFTRRGVPLKVERGGRVFPVSDRAEDIAQCLVRSVRSAGAFITRDRALSIEKSDDCSYRIHTATGKEYIAPNVCISTGGLSYPLTGSTGDGYKFAEKFGHTIVPLQPSLVPLVCNEQWCGQLAGVSLKNIRLTAYEDGVRIYSDIGEMLFTHFGVSGPLVLTASSHMRNWGKKRYGICLDLKPGLSEEKLDLRIQRDFAKYHGRTFPNALQDLLIHSMIPVVTQYSEIQADLPVDAVTRVQRKRLVKALKGLPLSVSGTRPISEAIVTAGGVSTKEINPRSMESKICPGLYFAGEVMNLDAITGGFNLQIAWTTGYVAGMSMVGR
jgi:predicted Rossmann fold flavoprotein